MERWIDGCEIINRILRGAIGAIGIDIYIRYFENVWYAFFICIFDMMIWYIWYIWYALWGIWDCERTLIIDTCVSFFEMFISRKTRPERFTPDIHFAPDMVPWLHENSSQPNQMVPWFWRNHWPVWPVFCSIFVDWLKVFASYFLKRPRNMFQWCSIKVSFVNFFCWLPEVFHSRRFLPTGVEVFLVLGSLKWKDRQIDDWKFIYFWEISW